MANQGVEITLRFSASFVRLLNANAMLNPVIRDQLQKGDPDRQLTPAETLTLVALSEARGGREMETHASTPTEWRGEIEPVCEKRTVIP